MLVFLLGVLFELGVVLVQPVWRLRQFIVPVLLVLLGFWLGTSLTSLELLSGLVLTVIVIFRMFNLVKIGQSKLHENYLKRITTRSSLTLVGLNLLCVWLINSDLNLSINDFFLYLAVGQLLFAMLALATLAKNLIKTEHHASRHFYSDKELPSITVAIPARNETHDLASCLHSILASNYPKLEILVLDDCSQDRTSEIIKDFAHDGVRFIQGSEPQDRWLAKNQAYDKLADEASGELIIFCGVDVRFGPDAIRSLVTTLLNKKRSMLSVMPLRIGGGVTTAFIQPMRYWWELVPPRRLFNRPPVLSTCWLIKRSALKKLGGFDAVSQNIVPEGYFARELIRKDQYAFIRANESLEIRTVKNVHEQLDTAIRTHYPQLKKRPENTLLMVLLELSLVLGPFILSLLAYWLGLYLPALLAATATVILILVHYMIMSASNPANVVIALVNFPFVVLTEIVIGLTSMYRYEFGKVEWKGRNICIPVMHVVAKLPDLDKQH